MQEFEKDDEDWDADCRLSNFGIFISRFSLQEVCYKGSSTSSRTYINSQVQ